MILNYMFHFGLKSGIFTWGFINHIEDVFVIIENRK